MHPTLEKAVARMAQIKRDERMNERRRERGSTFLDYAKAQADDERGGRFAKQQQQPTLGAAPPPRINAGPWALPDPVGTEPSLNIDVNAVDPVGEFHEVQRSIEQAQPHHSVPELGATEAQSEANPSSVERPVASILSGQRLRRI